MYFSYLNRVIAKNEVRRTKTSEIRTEFPAARKVSDAKANLQNLLVLTKGDLNFCVRGAPPLCHWMEFVAICVFSRDSPRK